MKDIQFAKFVVLVNGAVPLTMLGWDAWRGQLGVNPPTKAIHITGMLALVFLMLSLLVTPVRKVTGANWVIFARRTLGLYAFFYACLHLVLYYALQQNFGLVRTVMEIVKRWYLAVGFMAIVLMVPLAATSFNSMIKRLGGARWRAVHRLVYVVGVLAVIHFYVQAKADKQLPWVFIGVLVGLLGFRVVAWVRGRWSEKGVSGVKGKVGAKV